MAHYTRQKNVDVEVEERALSPTSEALRHRPNQMLAAR
jgi:hypothetical protein